MKAKQIDFILEQILVAIIGLQESVKDLTQVDDLTSPHEDAPSSSERKDGSGVQEVSSPSPATDCPVASQPPTPGDFVTGATVWFFVGDKDCEVLDETP
jgi:hypothetical protein